MYEQFMVDFTYRDSASRQVQAFISLAKFQATSLLHLLYFSLYFTVVLRLSLLS